MNKRFLIKPATSPLLLRRNFNIAARLIFILMGIINVSTKSFRAYMILLNFVLALMGVYYLFSGIFLLAPNLKFIPHVEIDENGILTRDDIFLRSRYYNWNHLKPIDLGIRQITTLTKSGIIRSFRINDREEFISEQVKSEIIEICS